MMAVLRALFVEGSRFQHGERHDWRDFGPDARFPTGKQCQRALLTQGRSASAQAYPGRSAVQKIDPPKPDQTVDAFKDLGSSV